MYYELYVDVLFLVNFFMDYILLLFVWKALHRDTRHIRIVAGAGLGALLTCILIILPIPNAFLEMILFHLVVNTCMIRVGFKIKQLSVFMRAFVLLYVGTFFMGGILESLQHYVKIGGLFLLFAIAGYYLSLGMWKFLAKLQRWNTCHVKVLVVLDGKELEMNALIDTGNSLTDPITGIPISVIEKKQVDHLLEDRSILRYIPYQTIGNGDGLMPIICAEKLWILDHNERCLERVLLGISEEDVSSTGEYEMILNPNLF